MSGFGAWCLKKCLHGRAWLLTRRSSASRPKKRRTGSGWEITASASTEQGNIWPLPASSTAGKSIATSHNRIASSAASWPPLAGATQGARSADRERQWRVAPTRGILRGFSKPRADSAGDAFLRERCGRAARAYAEKNFDIEAIADRFEEAIKIQKQKVESRKQKW